MSWARNDGNPIMHRRHFIASGLLATTALALPGRSIAGAAAAPIRELSAREGLAPLYGEGFADTAIWGYDGQAPGPVLRARQGDEMTVRLINDLSQATSIHWHGIRVPNAMDGVSGLTQDPVPPGEQFDYTFRVPDAGTYWYHAHNRSWEQVARGLHGILVVDEPDPPPVDQDLVFVVDDWRLDQTGAIHEDSLGDIRDWAHGGRVGNWVTVNGRSESGFQVTAGDRVRLRILNAANARIMTLAFPKHDPMVVAYDGQPVLPTPLAGSRLTVAPGQRADLMIDMGLTPGAVSPIQAVGREGPVSIAHFEYREDPVRQRDPLPPVAALTSNPIRTDLDQSTAVTARLLMEGGAMGRMDRATLDGRMMTMRELVSAGRVWAFNGVAGMTDQPLLRAETGRTVAIEMTNDTRWPHAMHLHGHHFTVARRDGRPIDGGPWRDTELLEPGERATIAFVADAPGRWLFHCHMLEHHAGGMVTWIEIV